MAYELWTSPSTGYRRRGTRAKEFRRLFEAQITISSISEPLRCCSSADAAVDVAGEMIHLGFDVVGVRESNRSLVKGYVQQSDLGSGSCEDHCRSFEPGDLVSDSMPLIDLVSLLGNKLRVFVLAGNDIEGIVTRADLQKPAVRILLFGLLSLLEMHMSYWARKSYPDNSWQDVLRANRIDASLKSAELGCGLQQCIE